MKENEQKIRKNERLSYHVVLGVEEACKNLLNNYGRTQKATIYTDSKAALHALSSPKINSNLVNRARKALSSLAGQLDLSII